MKPMASPRVLPSLRPKPVSLVHVPSSLNSAGPTFRAVRPATVPPLLGSSAASRLSTAPKATSTDSRAETSRKDARTVYDFEQWRKHRSTNRLTDRLLSLQKSNILRNIGSSVLWTTSVALCLTIYQHLYETHSLPATFHSLSPSMAAQAFISTTTVALSLLLVFRTNAGYGRWDEARKMWGLLINRTRDLMREADSTFPLDNVEARKAMARWIIAFARSLRIHLQPEVTVKSELENVLLPEELKMLEASSHRPVKTIHVMSQIINGVEMSPMYQMRMSENLTAFHDILGGCERILRAPIPVSYTRHTARFLLTWLTLLPFSLFGTCGVWTAPVAAGIAAVLCGIEEIGVQVEEPFGILPLDVICGRIQTDVMSTLKDGDDVRSMLQPSLRREGEIIQQQRSVLEDTLKRGVVAQQQNAVLADTLKNSMNGSAFSSGGSGGRRGRPVVAALTVDDGTQQRRSPSSRRRHQVKRGPMAEWQQVLVVKDGRLE